MLSITRLIRGLTEAQVQWCIDNSDEIDSWNKVIITVPHSLCLPENIINHWCDYTALDFAHKLSARTGVEVIPAIASRKRCDFNRVLCPEPSLLDEYLSMIDLADATLIVDVHSYPASYLPYGQYEVVLLDPKNGSTSYSRSLVSFLVNNGVNAAIIRASVLNNLVVAAMLLNSPCVMDKVAAGGILLEINEGLSSMRTDFIADVVTEWILSKVRTFGP